PDSPDPATVPGFYTGATSMTVHMTVLHVSDFDASRGRAGLDASVEVSPAIGLGAGDDSRYVSIVGRAAYGQPLGGGRALVLSAMAGDQESMAPGVDFYDRFSLGGGFFHRGFASARFRGGSFVLASLDLRAPIATWVDAIFFVENGGAFGESFSGFKAT